MPKKNKDYWQQRFDQIEQSANNRSTKYVKQLEKKYQIAAQQIDGQINAWYQRIAANNEVSMTEARKLLSSSELKEFKWTVEDYIKYGQENAIDQRWMKELENASAKFHINRLEALKLECRQQIEQAFAGGQQSMYDTLADVYKDTFYHSCFEIQKGVGVGFDVSALDDGYVSRLLNKPWSVDGENFSSKVWKNKTKLINNLDQELSRMVLTGSSPQRAIQNIRKSMDTSLFNAKRLVLTEQAYFTSVAQKDAFAELDVDEYEIVATLDGRTSEICQEMDGKHFPVSQMAPGVNAPPFHVFCRSTTCPYFDDEFMIGSKRAARDEDGKTYYVPYDMTYPEWKKSFVDGDLKEDLQEIVPDIKFATKQGSHISPKQKFNDTMTVTSAYNDLPVKVKQNFGDVTFEFGYDGSACDILHKTIRVGTGTSKEEVFHEVGHLIENYMMKSSDVKKYKEFLVDGLTDSDIIRKTYYDTVGNGVDIFILKGNRFESEYQSRLYVSNVMDALNPDGTINVDVLGEVVSEPFRKYMNGEGISNEARTLIEGVVL